jgi:hypothetical protein
VLVVGGTDTVSDDVVTALQKPGVTVTRIAGADRYETAALVARQIGAPAGAAVTAPGDDASLAAAVSAASVAAALDRPLLLVRPDAVPSAIGQVVEALKIRSGVCVGATSQLAESVRTSLPACTRVANASDGGAPATAAALVDSLDRSLPMSVVAVVAPSAKQLSDGVAAAAIGLPVVFAGPASTPAATIALLQKEPGVTRLRVFGGYSSVSAAVVTRLQRS